MSSTNINPPATTFTRTTLSRRVMFLVLLPFIASFCLLLILTNLSRQLDHEAERERMAEAAISNCILLSQMVIDTGVELAQYSMSNGTSSLESYERVHKLLPELTSRLENVSSISPELHRIAAQINETANAMLKVSEEAVIISESGGGDIAELRQREIHGLIEPVIIRLTGLFASFSQELNDYIAASPTASPAVRKTIMYVALVGLVALTLLTFIIISILTRSISSRLEAISRNSRLLAQSQALPPPLKGEDEIAEIDRAFHMMADLLESSRQRELSAVVGAADVICTVGGDYTIKTVNPAASKVLGIVPEQIIGKSVLSLTEDTEGFERARKEGHHSFKCGFARKDGTNLTVLWVVSWSDADDVFFCVLHDISEIEALEKRLLENEQQLTTIFARMPAGLFVLDCNRRIQQCNAKAATMLEFAQSNLIGMAFADLMMPGEDTTCSESISALRRLRKNGDGMLTVELLERKLDAASGESLVIIIDVTERQRKRERRSRLVSSVVAEVAQPLEQICANIQSLSESFKGNDSITTRLTSLFDESQRIVRLFNELLLAEAVDNLALSSIAKPTEVSEAVTWAAEIARDAASRKNIQLQTDCAQLIISLDKDRLLQVLTNLLSNAIKFAPPYSVISITGGLQDGGFVLQVSDQGPGIPAGKEEEIFQPFKQASLDDAYRKGGAGLGLFICRTIAEQLGGTLIVSNNDGPGCTFTLTLPEHT